MTVPGERQPTVGEEVDEIGRELREKRLAADGHDETPVPAGHFLDNRIPESMKAGAPDDWTKLPVAQVEVLPEYGPEHDRIVALRKELEQVKRTIDSLGPACETHMKLTQKLASGGLSEEDQTMVMTKDEDAKRRRDAAFDSIDHMVAGIEDTDATTRDTTKSCMEEMARELRERGSVDFASKEHFSEYWTFCRAQTQKIFKENRMLLERIKAIKKAHQQAGKERAEEGDKEKAKEGAEEAAPAA